MPVFDEAKIDCHWQALFYPDRYGAACPVRVRANGRCPDRQQEGEIGIIPTRLNSDWIAVRRSTIRLRRGCQARDFFCTEETGEPRWATEQYPTTGVP